jgi:hypothetical protein
VYCSALMLAAGVEARDQPGAARPGAEE